MQLDACEDGSACDAQRLLFIFNGHHEQQWITLPQLDAGRGWYRSIDTSLSAGRRLLRGRTGGRDRSRPIGYIANPRSTVLLLAR
jgi:hypothetical protein